MRLEATGTGVQCEGFDVDEKISLFDFTGIMVLFYLIGHNCPVHAFSVNHSFINKKLVFVIQFPLLALYSRRNTL